MLKKFWEFIKRIFNKKTKALPESTIDYSNDLEGAISAAENTSSFLENNDELILTIEKNSNEEKANINIEVLRNGKKIETEQEELDKEKIVTYLKNIDIEEDEIVEESGEIAVEPAIEEDAKTESTPLILETEIMKEDEKISDLINGEYSTEKISDYNESIEEIKIEEVDNKELAKEYFEENEKCENFETSVSYIKAFGIDDNELEEVVKQNRNILTTDSDDVLENLNSLTNAGFLNKDIYNMIKKEPEILTDYNIKDSKLKINLFKEKGLDGNEVYSLYINNPNLLLLETKRLEQSFKIIKKFYRTKDRIHYIMRYFPKAIGMVDLAEIRKCVEKM